MARCNSVGEGRSGESDQGWEVMSGDYRGLQIVQSEIKGS